MNYSLLAVVYFATNTLVFSQAGALDIRVHPGEGELYPPAQLLVQDPSGRRCGTDRRGNVSFAEIPLATYESERIDDDETGARGPETRILYLPQTQIGEYRLSVIGTDFGFYSLEIRYIRDELEDDQSLLLHEKISPGELTAYLISVDNDGIKVRVVSPSSSSP